MLKLSRLAQLAVSGVVLAGCSSQQTSQQAPMVQTAQASPIVATSPPNNAQSNVLPMPKEQTVIVAKPVAMVKPKPAERQTPWQQRQLAMNRMQTWSMGGRAALKFKSDAWTFGLNWLQRNRQQYSLQIKHPITGTVIGILDQSPGRATLKSRGKVTSGTDAEKLLQQQLGVKMPVNGMPYWIRGVMAPQYPAGKVSFDSNGKPKQIIQAGWVVDYANYKGSAVDALPQKVNISRAQEQVNVRIVAKQWQTR